MHLPGMVSFVVQKISKDNVLKWHIAMRKSRHKKNCTHDDTVDF